MDTASEIIWQLEMQSFRGAAEVLVANVKSIMVGNVTVYYARLTVLYDTGITTDINKQYTSLELPVATSDSLLNQIESMLLDLREAELVFPAYSSISIKHYGNILELKAEYIKPHTRDSVLIESDIADAMNKAETFLDMLEDDLDDQMYYYM